MLSVRSSVNETQMFLLIVFYLKSFPHEVQVVICNLRNLYHKIISIPVAMYGLKNVVEHGLLGNAGKGAVL